MNTRWFAAALLVACAIALGVMFGCHSGKKPGEEYDPEPAITVPDEDLKALADGNNAFALDLYKKFAEKHDGNLILSPYSISSALAMTYAGTRGETAEQMKRTLHFTLPPERLHLAFGGVTGSLHTAGKKRPYELCIANALWAQQGIGFVPEFLDVTNRCYGSARREVNFGAPEAARGTINRWVEEQTRDRIKDLLKSQDITPNVRLILTNAIYFKGTWKHQFSKERTFEGNFETGLGVKVKVWMMRHTDIKLRTYAGEAWQLLELPYEGERLSMILLLPNERCGLQKVASRLTLTELENGLAQLQEQKLGVFLPRFKFESRAELGRTLSELGMPLAFSAGDFSGITPRGGLQMADVIHGGSVEVDELGTTAAAATTVKTTRSAPPNFQADHPFLFFLRDAKSGQILFVGRVSDPRQIGQTR
ncbi:MAG: serpin family protein [Planctomycetes bacterium]|nr:serpin family protein [Planctomycetota bacterium]